MAETVRHGTAAFDIERAHLTIDGDVVHLWIDVTPTTRQAFG